MAPAHMPLDTNEDAIESYQTAPAHMPLDTNEDAIESYQTVVLDEDIESHHEEGQDVAPSHHAHLAPPCSTVRLAVALSAVLLLCVSVIMLGRIPSDMHLSKGVGKKSQSDNLLVRNEACTDNHLRCSDWAREGECSTNPSWMHVNCMMSCGQCDQATTTTTTQACTDSHLRCSDWAREGECSTNPSWMHVNCKMSCGQCGQVRTTTTTTHVPTTTTTTHDVSKTWGPDGSVKHCRPNGGSGVHKRTRREVQDWSDVEWKEFHRAVEQLKEDGQYDALVKKHVRAHEAHMNNEFLPWHRAFLEEFETALQRVAKTCSLTLPWWNWGAESGGISKSIVWRPHRYGSLRSGCIRDGIAANWSDCIRDPAEFSPWRRQNKEDCVHRNPKTNFRFDKKLPAWPLVYQNLLRKKTYSGMRRSLEAQTHNAFHGMVRGNMGTFASPNDPIFFAHHGFVDFAWFAWQRFYQHASESQTCGNCNDLKDFGNASATDYVGQYSSSPNDCVLYPPSNPRICLAYTTGPSVRQLTEMQPSPCQKLMAQVTAGQCSRSELAKIKVIDQCMKAESANKKLAWEWVSMTLKHESHACNEHGDIWSKTRADCMKDAGIHHPLLQDSWTEIKVLIQKEWAHFLEHQQVTAKTAEESITCISCDLECTGLEVDGSST